MRTPPRRTLPALLWIGVVLVLVAAVSAWPYARRHVYDPGSLGGFAAFSCAGQVLRGGADPYRAEPLRRCEQALPSYRYAAAGVVEPAPFPPPVLLAFAPLALLPLGVAFAIYAALALAAIGFATWALARLTELPGPFIAASLAVAALYQNLKFGEVPPLVIGILCGAALLLERRRYGWAVAVGALALIEPHVAAPVFVALLIAVKPARVPLVIAGVVLAAFTLAVAAPATLVEYFFGVLPAHAASEVGANDQYSVTWLAHQLGVADGRALQLGSISYVVAATLGIVLAMRLARRFERPAFLVFVPAAFAMMGGAFIHDIQLPIALPAALLLLAVAEGRARIAALVAVMVLAVTWFDDSGALLGVTALAVMVWTSPVAPAAPGRRVALVFAVCAAFALVILGFHRLPGGVNVALPAHPDLGGPPGELASEVWGRYVRATAYGHASLRTVAEKLPLFGALVLLAYATFATARGSARAQA
jgi:alpha-1,2-mannosyltransferase